VSKKIKKRETYIDSKLYIKARVDQKTIIMMMMIMTKTKQSAVILFVVLIVAAATLNSIDGAAVKTNSLVREIRNNSNDADADAATQGIESETERNTSKRRNLAPADDDEGVGVLDTKASKSSKKNSKGGGYYGTDPSSGASASSKKASKAKSNKSCKKSAKSTDEG
jgi:hypothetical protein